MKLRFPKSERIRRKEDIELLFSQGKSLHKGTLGIKYVLRERNLFEPSQMVLIVVSKKKVKKAVDRNKLKRQLREIYRRNQNQFQTDIPKDETLLLACIFHGQSKENFHVMEKDFLFLKKKLRKKLATHTD